MKNLLIGLPFFLFACAGDFSADDLLPDASGEHGHVLVVMDDNLWEGKIGESLRAQFDQTAPGIYLRPETMFAYFHKKTGTLTHVNKMGRLILKIFVDHDSVYKETAVVEKPDYWAKGQLFLVIKDSDPNRLSEFITTDFMQVLNKLNDFETIELVKKYRERPNNAVTERAEVNFGISISVPRESKLKVDKSDFMWVKYDRSRSLISNEVTEADGGAFWVQEGLVFWSEPYSELALNPYHILEKRDTIMKYNVLGKIKGSYMGTEYDSCCAPEAWVTEYNGNDCVIFRGLWKYKGRRGVSGGGPFVQYSIHNPNKNTVVTVAGYIFAPKFDKREYIRELDAMLSTIVIVP